MPKFNTPSTSKVTNLAGGEAYDMNTKEKLASVLLTSFVQNQFYRSENSTIEEIKKLVSKDPLFAAKASIYARNEFGMRSISHVVAGEIFRTISGQKWVKQYLDKVIYRADDMSEIVSYYAHNVANRSPLVLPGQLKKGLARAMVRFDEYQLAKYRSDGKEWSLVDIANLVHPKGNDAIKALINGTLKNTDTWESRLSASNGDESKKSEAWASLINENKLGYLALLRNLNNIAEQAPSVLDTALKSLTNKNLIKKSLVLPFQIVTAIENLDTSNNVRPIVLALNEAIETALDNVPKFDGKTLIVVDNSGSMQGYGNSKSPIIQASLFASVLYKSNDSDLMVFSDSAQYVNLNPTDSIASLMKLISGSLTPAGTNFHAPFQTANKVYDRIIILSDNQGWMGYNSPASSLANYEKLTGAHPFVYSWDLSGYGSFQLPQNRIALLAGFSEKIFDVMKLVETDKKALVHRIEEIRF